METVNDRLHKEKSKTVPKYEYPMEVLTGKDYRLAKHGQTFRLRREDCCFVSELDSMRESKKQIFGGGLLLSDKATAERRIIEQAADAERDREMEKKATAGMAGTEMKDGKIVWKLSDRERWIIASMKGDR